MQSNLKDKVILITGSNTGIGAQTALEFARQGSVVIITYYTNRKSALQTKKDCISLGSKEADVLPLDITKDKSIKDVVDKVVSKYKKIDVLVNNAGVVAWKPLVQQTFKEIQNQIRVNLEGLIKMTNYALPYIKEAIINISSGAGKTAHATLSTYCATKFGVRGFTQTIAKELPRLKVYCVNPRMTATAMTNYRGDPPQKVAQIIVNALKGKYNLPSGSDVDVWDYL